MPVKVVMQGPEQLKSRLILVNLLSKPYEP